MGPAIARVEVMGASSLLGLCQGKQPGKPAKLGLAAPRFWSPVPRRTAGRELEQAVEREPVTVAAKVVGGPARFAHDAGEFGATR